MIKPSDTALARKITSGNVPSLHSTFAPHTRASPDMGAEGRPDLELKTDFDNGSICRLLLEAVVHGVAPQDLLAHTLYAAMNAGEGEERVGAGLQEVQGARALPAGTLALGAGEGAAGPSARLERERVAADAALAHQGANDNKAAGYGAKLCGKGQGSGWGRCELVCEAATDAIEWLVDNKFVRRKLGEGEAVVNGTAGEGLLEATQLGEATVSSGLSPQQGLEVFDALSRARQALSLQDEGHLLFLLTPVYHSVRPNYKLYNKTFHELSCEVRHVARLVGIDDEHLHRLAMRQPSSKYPAGVRRVSGNSCHEQPPQAQAGLDRSAASTTETQVKGEEGEGGESAKVLVMERFWVMLMLREVMFEAPLPSVCQDFGVTRGTLQTLQSLASTFAGQVAIFCGKLRWWQLQVLCKSFQDRLETGAQPDVVELARVPHVKTHRARALVASGITSLDELACSSLHTIARALDA